jgi:hypothetical protein
MPDLRSAGRRHDPVQSTTLLTFEAEYFPMGYPFRIATNSRQVLSIASRTWSRYPRLSAEPPIHLSITVTPSDGAHPPPAPTFQNPEHRFSIVADSANFATADLRSGTGYAYFADNVPGDYLRYQFLEPLAYMLIAAPHLVYTHAACVALEGHGVLLCGDSGAGKTCLAFACARKGWTFLSGDATGIVRGRDDHRVLGRPFEIRFRETARHLFPELERYPRSIRPNGKDDIELDPRDLGLTCAMKGRASQIVFLERSPQPLVAVAEVYSRDEVLRQLEPAICLGDESCRREQWKTLEALVTLPAHRLRYHDMDSAERVLRSLVGVDR